ncbi:MAG TPA: hypothetical protein VN836_12735 [Verrucomicrobiae bacterium]|nr:hypothetical protein [Verrucomicrobiae bacterium]
MRCSTGWQSKAPLWRNGGKAGVEALKEAGVKSHHYESPLTAHERQSWRRSLHEIAPLLFNNSIDGQHHLC